ncbi:BACON domain-containing protein, partial [Odoribacter splanchnicus]|uniref:BACON domain-containing protein n=1 Tax=Odoribacter splanchnicus TaxID=28118 RepID=UPI001C710DBA
SKIIVTVGVYSEMEDRNTNLTVKAGNITKVLTVTQKDGDAIILSKDKFDIPEEGGNVTVEVKSNIQYEVSIPSQFQNWIKHEPETKAITVKNFTFTILENKEYEKREGYIVFNGNSLKDTVHIYQTADPRTLILSKDTYNISSAKESIEVELKSNVDYSISIPSSASHWIKLLETKAIRTDKIYFEIEENTTYDNRSAQVFIKDKNSSLCDTLYINQLQQNALILSQKQYEVLAGGEQISIEVQSNIDYEIIIPKTVQEWIEQMPQSKALTKSMINLEVKPNPTDDVRSAQIFIKDKNSTLSDTVQVTQAAKGIYIGDIIFETEQDLIDFQTAGYTKVRGNVIVSGGEITTLQKLDNLLTEINGSLRLECSTLTTLDGLYGLKTITDSLIIKDGDMTSFEGLRNLGTIGGNFKVIAESSYSYYYYSLNSLSSFKGLSG